MSTGGGNLRKLNMRAQLQTLPYPAASKSFYVFQRLHGYIGRTNSDVQKRDGEADRQTDRQTDKQKNNVLTKKLNIFGRPGGG